jgi:hypothetical protein
VSVPTITELRDWVVDAVNDMSLGHTAVPTWRAVREKAQLSEIKVEIVVTNIEAEPESYDKATLQRSVLVLVRKTASDPDSVSEGDEVAQLCETIARGLLGNLPDHDELAATPVAMELGTPIDPEVLNELGIFEAAAFVTYQIHGA